MNKSRKILESLKNEPTWAEVVDKLPLPETPSMLQCGDKIREAIRYEMQFYAKNNLFHTAYIGVDPGVSGAAVALSPGIYSSHPGTVSFVKVEAARDFGTIGGMIEMAQLMSSVTRKFRAEVIIEEVHAMPRQGVSSTFTFGRAYGRAEGHCDANNIEPSYYPPQAWMKIMRKMFYLDKNPRDWRPYAAAIFPTHEALFMKRKKDHNTAEAALVAVAHVMNKGTYAETTKKSKKARPL